MMTADFSNATLILVGHGSLTNADSSAPTYQHADELRRRGIFAEVIECFWKLEPSIASVLRGAYTPNIFVVPLFISEGYFTEQIIPRELGLCGNNEPVFPRVQARGNQKIYYSQPIGTHASMTEALLSRAKSVVEQHPFPRAPKPAEITLYIAGHGTSNNENSRKAIEDQVALIRERNIYAQVEAVFMEEEPRIASCYDSAATRNLVMVPFFISDGLHSYEDIPEMLGETKKAVAERMKAGQPTWRNPSEKHGKLVWYSRSIGNETHIADVIMERVLEIATNQPPVAA